MRNLAILSVAALLSGATNAAAARSLPSYHVRPSFDRCMSSSGGVTVAMLDCIGAEYDFQDGVLNARYRTLMARLNARQRTTLRSSQRRWLLRREAACVKESSKLGEGTLADLNRNQDMLSELIWRIDWLSRYRF